MSLSNLHTLDDSSGASSEYKTKRFEILSLLEGKVATPYFDSKGIITIGIGFNIDVEDTRDQTHQKNSRSSVVSRFNQAA